MSSEYSPRKCAKAYLKFNRHQFFHLFQELYKQDVDISPSISKILNGLYESMISHIKTCMEEMYLQDGMQEYESILPLIRTIYQYVIHPVLKQTKQSEITVNIRMDPEYLQQLHGQNEYEESYEQIDTKMIEGTKQLLLRTMKDISFSFPITIHLIFT
jgi:hypothetical protein